MRKSASVLGTLHILLLFVTSLACLIVDGSSGRCSEPVLLSGSPKIVQTETAPGNPSFQNSKTHIEDTYGRLPLSFEANQGQTDSQVRFLSRGKGSVIYLTSTEAVLQLLTEDRHHLIDNENRRNPKSSIENGKLSVLRMKLKDGTPNPKMKGLELVPGKRHYFIGNNPEEWRTHVSSFAKVRYSDVYPGVDLVYHGNQRQLEYDFVINPGAKPEVIKMDFTGAQKIDLDEAGNLVLQVDGRELRQSKPTVYQELKGVRRELEGSYIIDKQRRVGFQVVSDYDMSQPLVIDPVLSYSTFLGGSNGLDEGHAITVDSSGNAYITGMTLAADFPTRNSVFLTPHGQTEVFVTKLNPSGTDIVFSTYLGGASDDIPYGITLDAGGNIYVTGSTNSPNYSTKNPITPSSRGLLDAFVTKIGADGSALVFSTYLGGSGDDVGRAIAVDASNNVYVAGSTDSLNFPTLNAIQSSTPSAGVPDLFLTKIVSGGNSLAYSSYLGGSNVDEALDMVADASGNIYVTGKTASLDFRIQNPLQATHGGGTTGLPYDAFVLKVSSAPALVYSTFLGGNGDDIAYGIALDSSGNAYVTGTTTSTNFPGVSTGFQKSLPAGAQDGFVAKVNPSGTALVYSSYLSGHDGTVARDVAVDSAGSAYVAGGSTWINFPRVSSLQPFKAGGNWDAFVMKVNATGSDLLYSTNLGGSGDDFAYGIAVDSAGNAYVTGYTESSNYPTLNAFQATLAGGGRDGFVSKISESDSLNLFVPIILSSSGLNNSFFTSEMVLTNRGTQAATVSFFYTPLGGSIAGPASTTLAAGQQKIISNAVEYLRTLGLSSIPASGNRLGTLSVRFAGLSSASDGAVTVRTTTAVANGRAGLAYAGIPIARALTATSYLCGLRQNSTDRANVAVQNAGGLADGNVVLRLTVYSGASNTTSKDLPDITLLPGGFQQISGILASNGLSFSNGYVRIQRVSGTAPYYAYAVINDQANSDGSFVPPISEDDLTGRQGLSLPVIVETPLFNSELVLSNFGSVPKSVSFEYVADAIQTSNKTATFSLNVNAGEQLIIPSFVQYLRSRGVAGIGPAGGAVFVGALFAKVNGGDISGLFLGARTSTPGGGGRFGLFYTAVPNGAASTNTAWLYGLQQNAENRTNLALINTGEEGSAADVFTIDLFNGDTGQKVNSIQATLNAKSWQQFGTILSTYAAGTTQGYARIKRTSGINPFITYSVVNDGATATARTGDGAFVQSTP